MLFNANLAKRSGVVKLAATGIGHKQNRVPFSKAKDASALSVVGFSPAKLLIET